MSMENFANLNRKMRIIPAKTRQEFVQQTTGIEVPKLRVTPYARVSTEHEEQESSYNAQVEHFEQLLARHTEWELVDIYADPGLSGKNVKRKNFQRLMEDCENGKVDMIITKSVSRFARNTLDCVHCVRHLREKGIKVYFEKENLDTLQENREFVLTLLASLAEEESRSLSTNIRWSVKKRFQEGQLIMNTANFLGYQKDKENNLHIVPEEAVIVKRIYRQFLDGYSLQKIANELMNEKIPSPSGKEIWYVGTIQSILKNEKYKGDCILQKTYLPDFLSPRRVKNEGQATSYYVEDHHPAIIAEETFEMVQQEFKKRNELRAARQTGKGKYSGKYLFSGLIICGECGETYRRHQQYYKTKIYNIWVCKRHENTGKNSCPAKPIRETALEQGFVRALNEVIENKEELLKNLQTAAVITIDDSCEEYVKEIDKEIEEKQTQVVELLLGKQGEELTEEEYQKQGRKLQYRIDELKVKREEAIREQSKVQLAQYRAEAVKELLKTGKILEEFDADLVKSLVKQIKVLPEKEVEFEFECGIKVRKSVKQKERLRKELRGRFFH